MDFSASFTGESSSIFLPFHSNPDYPIRLRFYIDPTDAYRSFIIFANLFSPLSLTTFFDEVASYLFPPHFSSVFRVIYVLACSVYADSFGPPRSAHVSTLRMYERY